MNDKEIQLKPETIEFVIKTMTIAYGALSVVGSDGNQVSPLLRRLEISIAKLVDPGR